MVSLIYANIVFVGDIGPLPRFGAEPKTSEAESQVPLIWRGGGSSQFRCLLQNLPSNLHSHATFDVSP